MSLPPDFCHAVWPTHSLYAQRWLNRFPAWNADTDPALDLITLINRWLEPARGLTDEAGLMKALRLARQRSMVEIMRRDLLKQAELFEVTEALSFLADASVQIALNHCHQAQAERYGEPEQQDSLMVVGMGKLGGLELNASSDIDLIFLYNQDGETLGGPNGRKQSHAEFFTQVGRKLIKLISEVTEDGFVFRVDMRLRPNGDSGPLVVSLDMLEEYFMVQGREWERYAWIKARVINWTVNPKQDEAFQQSLNNLNSIIRPFVYRKYLDFGAIRALRALHAQIRSEVNKREHQHPGTVHVKLGRGGIREIEFTAQAFQLIRGGREPKLQRRRTVDVLAICVELGLLNTHEFERMVAAYHFLRDVEHRLQYVDDAQTHRLPAGEADVQRIALSMGYQDAGQFQQTLTEHMAFVADHFDLVFGDKAEDEETADLSLPWPDKLTQGFKNPQAAQDRYQQFIESGRYQTLPTAHRERVDRLMPALLAAAGSSNEPDTCWKFCCDLIETVSRRGAYLSLLDEYPVARMRVSRILAASPWAAHFLIRHPILLDELLDSRTLLAPPNFNQWKAQLREALSHAVTPDGQPDLERQMDLVREQHHAQLFRVLAQDLENLLTVEVVSDLLSELADCTLEVVLESAWSQVPKRHLERPKFAIIAYGKHGGKELGYASDLDMIFLFEDDDDRAPELYASLAKRVNRWLTTHTAAGTLFETDFRLRPNGEAGLLVSTVDSFEAYQRREGGVGAWFWEHQALTRARFCVGDAHIGQRFEALRDEILCLPRDWTEVKREVISMRHKMLEGHPNPTELFDVKHDRGGMVDVEFMVQALVLGHSHQHPALTKNKGNIALLKKSGELGLIPADLALSVADAYRLLRAKQHALRLAGYEKSRSSDPAMMALRKPIQALWTTLMGEE
ncbi:bifunctional [glutamate--ammonia ligase]-adenylyl-L-tyrosine phosphorylase/[glutamate--ammonia-ligase] adenylyltransferase [Limnobacter humi]|uniref:Bifunctional glutamine synthetase adenylyltransferase/adenylyl-removing enzyme n=1 Tax=Limnobacter humi TaxID=1778671 RepID=A0ABT1WHK4_9BURK|nr:bifunctional [glutamate--ammonia ligase]-adenylyl-L-tyrosine phosphorylase/[glutamate--ammonia-ligase] adenylyltransferase [Limnobacter humi]MCQ8896997.1 bifunctional [glutamate--ammonia ligase]-adenylyl-L-tyrosine phosphorylase/[glutamate--ammonia-ligase] adenylyltransferase [Limnobacter humi]